MLLQSKFNFDDNRRGRKARNGKKRVAMRGGSKMAPLRSYGVHKHRDKRPKHTPEV